MFTMLIQARILSGDISNGVTEQDIILTSTVSQIGTREQDIILTSTVFQTGAREQDATLASTVFQTGAMKPH